MKKRVFALLLSAAVCQALVGQAFAARGYEGLNIVKADGKLQLTGTSTTLKDGDKITVFTKSNGADVPYTSIAVSVDENGNVSAELPDGEVGDFGIVIGNYDPYYGESSTDESTSESETPGESETAGESETPGESETAGESETPGESETAGESETPDESGTPGESTSEPGRPVNPDTPSGGSTSDDDDDSSGGGGGGGSSISTNPNPIKYKGKTEKQTPTQITTPNTGWTSNAGSQMVFFDVQTTDWFANAVNYVTQNGMMVGSNNRFSPNDRLTRGMMAQILYNIEGNPATGTANFPDVNSSDWFANAVAWASANGCMSGYANGRFGPNDPITREQLAAILYRYSGMKGYTTAATAELTGFVDGNATSGWAQTSMRWAVTTGLLSGKTGNRLDPTGTATRAEVAQILMNFGTKIAQ